MGKDNDPQLYDSGYERNRLDRYWTNPWMIDELFRCLAENQIGIDGPVWECAAGRGDIAGAIENNMSGTGNVYSSDIDIGEFDKNIGPCHERSFLDEFQPPEIEGKGVQAIITNPPYNSPWRGISDDFVRQGLSFFDQGIEFMAMLQRSEYRCGKTRKDMFGDCPHYLGELVLTTRPRWDYGDPDAPEKAAPRHNFSWFMWQKNVRRGFDGGRINSAFQFFSYTPKRSMT